MQKHFESLKKDYSGDTVVLNLISNNKGIERPLYTMQRKVMDAIDIEKNAVKYYHFDFHSECHLNSNAMMQFCQEDLLARHLGDIGIFVQTNYIVSEKSLDGLIETKKLIQDVE